MKAHPYQICVQCLMDTTDPEIHFDPDGVCNHCHIYDQAFQIQCLPGIQDPTRLSRILNQVKEEGKHKPYDCILGVSGGVDSTFLAYQAREWGLRPLAVHMDNGWNSELAVSNIEKMLRKLDMDLHTTVIDWEAFKALQLSFLKSDTPDLEIPTDHIITAVLHETAEAQKVRFILSGYNCFTEAIHPRLWSHGHHDWKYIHGIHSRFSNASIERLPHYTLNQLFRFTVLRRQKTLCLLNFIPFQKNKAVSLLEEKLEWRNYGGKHCESLYTRFVQEWIHPKKFGFQKRRAHLSCLIRSQQVTREQALVEMEIKNDSALQKEVDYVLKKLDLSQRQFDDILKASPKSFWNYPSYESNLLQQALLKLFIRTPNPVEIFRTLQRKLLRPTFKSKFSQP